jgi:hypothetical protein
MAFAFIERLESNPFGDRWLVREDDELRIAVVYATEPSWTRALEGLITPWIGFSHEAIATVRTVTQLDDKLVVVHDVDRGPHVGEAAMAIPDDQVRAQWAVTQVVAIAGALAAMRARDPGYVHRWANLDEMFVATDGRARLCAPIPYLARQRVSGYLGRGYALTARIDWLAPEQVRGTAETAATDVFQLAASLYRLVTGTHYAPRPDGDFERMKAIVDGPPPAPPTTITAELGRVIVRGLARPVDARYPDPATFAAALRAAAPAIDPSAGLAAVTAWRPTAKLRAGAPLGPIAGERCQKAWDELKPTGLADVRYCTQCTHEVVRATSLLQVVPLLGRACIAYDPE